MSKTQQEMVVRHAEPKLKLSSYVAGFFLSLVFTLAAYLLVINHAASRNALVGLIVLFAFSQFIVQALLFLHLGKESKPRWKLGIFLCMVGVVTVLVFGSLWIIYNLNVRMSIPQQIEYMNSQDNL